MQNEFDDHFKKQVDGFRLPPSPQIWDLVEAQLPEKKRRRFIFWWLPLGILLIGFGVYELVGHGKNYKNSIAEKTIIQTKETVKKDSISNLFTMDKSKINQNENIIKTTKKSNLQMIHFYGKNKNEIKNNIKSKSKLNNVGNEPDNKILLKNDETAIIKGNNKNEIAKNEIKLDTIENKVNKEKMPIGIIEKTIVSTVNKLSQKEVAINKKDTTIIKDKKAENKTNPKKANWELIVEIGNSNTVGKAFGITDGTVYSAPSSFQASPGNGITSPASNLSSPTAGVSFGFYFQHTKQITKYLAWYGSIGYRYSSNHQASGVLVDSSATVGNSSLALSLDKADKIDSYYKYGNSLNHTNGVHLLNIFVGLKYNINKAFSLNGGIGLGYQIKSKWLQPDLAKSILYYSDKLTNKWDFGTRIGVDWQFAKPFLIGVFYYYNFSKASLADVQQKLHWQSIGATFSVQLPFKK